MRTLVAVLVTFALLGLLLAGIYLYLMMEAPPPPTTPVEAPTGEAPPAPVAGEPKPVPPAAPELPQEATPDSASVPAPIPLDLDAAGSGSSSTAILRGRVLSPAKVPIAGATVSAYSSETESSSRVHSTADGSYEMSGAPTGEIAVRAWHPDWASESLHLELREGEALDGIDIVLDPGMTLSGHVSDADGRGIEDATVLASPQIYATKLESLTPRKEGVSAVDGSFELRGLEPMHYRVTASHEAYLPSEGRQIAAGERDVTIVLVQGAQVRGIVLGPDQTPLAGATVSATSRRQGASFPGGSETSTEVQSDENGEFQIGQLQAGELEVVALAQGYRESEPARVELTAGGLGEGLVLVLRSGVSLSGTVADGSGKPVAEARVVALIPREDGLSGRFGMMVGVPQNEQSPRTPGTTSAGDGTFTISGLNPGASYDLLASKDGYVRPQQVESQPTHVAPGSGILLTLVAGAGIHGTVLAPDGTPIGGATVLAIAGSRPVWEVSARNSATSGEDGSYELSELGAATYSLHASHQDHHRSEKLQITLTSGEDRADIDLHLLPGGEITGHVLDDNQAPIAGANIWAFDQAELMAGVQDTHSAVAAEDGSYTLKGLGDGAYSIGARADGFQDTSFAAFGGGGGAQLKGHAGDVVVITLSRGATIIGRVTTSDGELVTSFNVEVLSSQVAMGTMEIPIAQEEVTAAADGSFEISGVASGVSALNITAAGYARRRVVIEAFDPEGVNDVGKIALGRGATVLGHVRTTRGEPVSGASLAASAAGDTPRGYADFQGSGSAAATSDETGAFSLEHVPPGKHRLFATHPDLAPAEVRIEVPEGGELKGLLLEMASGGGIHGLVTDGQGQGVRGVQISAYPASGDLDLLARGARNATTDAEGVYRLRGLLEGTYSVSANLPSSGGGAFSQVSRSVVVHGEDDIACDFSTGALCRLFGKVSGWDPEEAAASGPTGSMMVLFALSGQGASQSVTQLGEDGNYSFDPMPAGDYQIMLFGSTTRQVTLPEAAEFRHDIQLPSALLSGLVVRADGEAPGVLMLRAVRRGDAGLMTRFAQGMTDAEGGFHLRNLVNGTYDLYVDVAAYGSGKLEGIELGTDEQRIGLRIDVRPGGELQVRVLAPGGGLDEKATVFCQDAQGNPVGIQSFGGMVTGGEVTLTGLPAGTYRLVAGSSENGTAWQDGVEVSAEADTAVEIALPPARGKVQVTATVDGLPLPGASIQLLDATGRNVPDIGAGMMSIFGGGSTDADGRYISGLLPAGKYRLRVLRTGSPPAEREIEIPTGDRIVEVELEL